MLRPSGSMIASPPTERVQSAVKVSPAAAAGSGVNTRHSVAMSRSTASPCATGTASVGHRRMGRESPTCTGTESTHRPRIRGVLGALAGDLERHRAGTQVVPGRVDAERGGAGGDDVDPALRRAGGGAGRGEPDLATPGVDDVVGEPGPDRLPRLELDHGSGPHGGQAGVLGRDVDLGGGGPAVPVLDPERDHHRPGCPGDRDPAPRHRVVHPRRRVHVGDPQLLRGPVGVIGRGRARRAGPTGPRWPGRTRRTRRAGCCTARPCAG